MELPDDVCVRYSTKKNLGLNIFMKEGMVMVEGNKVTLEFLADLFRAQARDKTGCGKQISPSGGGSYFFKKKSQLGLYIHKLENNGTCLSSKSVSTKRRVSRRA